MGPDPPIRVALVSLGCPKNLVDSERMLALLAEGGCRVGAPMDRADVIVINTCGFLASAREESLAVVREALSHKRAGKARRVVVAGCLSSRDGRRLYEFVPGIDAVVGVNDRDEILSAVKGRRRWTKLSPLTARPGMGKAGAPIACDAGRFRLTPRHTAYLRIAEGCSQRCTFCAIPSIRGPFRSKPPQAVLAEARELVADGTVELNVIAQDTTSYGIDLVRKAHGTQSVGLDLAWLLRELDRVDGLRWIRLLYTYPRRFTDGLIDALAQCGRVVPYVDLPLQHVSDPILRRMGRGVTRRGVETLLGKLRRGVPHLVIRTTFLVGFPGETDRHFQELLDFVEDFRFDALGVFEFSSEPGTPAAELPHQVPEDVKAGRAKTIMLAQQRIALAANARKVGRTMEVIVDGTDSAGRCVGRHCGQAPDIDGLCILTEKRPAGRFVKGVVTGWDMYDLVVRPTGSSRAGRTAVAPHRA